MGDQSSSIVDSFLPEMPDLSLPSIESVIENIHKSMPEVPDLTSFLPDTNSLTVDQLHKVLQDTWVLLTNINNYWTDFISFLASVLPLQIELFYIYVAVFLAAVVTLFILIKWRLQKKNCSLSKKQEKKVICVKNSPGKPWINKVTPITTDKNNENKNTKMFNWFSFSKTPTNSDATSNSEKKTKGENKNEVQLIQKMGSEFRELLKGHNKEEREERQKELAKVRGARTFFKNFDQSLKSNPGIKFKTDEDFMENYDDKNSRRLATFVPGKLSSKFIEKFEEKSVNSSRRTPDKPPKKKLISENFLFKKELNLNGSLRIPNDELETLKTTPVKTRWNPVKQESSRINAEIRKELDDVRNSRPTSFQMSKERSLSADALHKITIPDDAWVLEKQEDKEAIEKQKALEELELVKQVRLESLDVIENLELERPSSRMEEKSRQEALNELEEVKKARFLAMEALDINIRDEVLKDSVSTEHMNKQIDDGQHKFIASTEAKFENILEHSMVKDLYESIAPETVPATNSFDFALALAADGLEEAALSSISYDIDEDFERKKRMIEEELRLIDEEYNQNHSKDELAEKILSAAESIQELASIYGNEDVNLSPNINRLKMLKAEKGQTVPENHPLLTSTESYLNYAKKNEIPKNADAQLFSSMNAVPKVKFRTDQEIFNSNSKRDTFEKEQFQRSKVKKSIKDKFEDHENIPMHPERNIQPKKKLITLDQILIKTQNDELKTEKDIELEIVKSLRKNWMPPEEDIHDTSKGRIEPGKLRLKNIYPNDNKEAEEKIKEQRVLELEEVRKSFAEKRETGIWNDEEIKGNLRQVEVRPRSRSEYRSDSYWMKEQNPNKIEDEKKKIHSELENVKQARNFFEVECLDNIEVQKESLKQIEVRPQSRSEFRPKMSDAFWVKEQLDEKLESEKVRIKCELESVKQARSLFEDEDEKQTRKTITVTAKVNEKVEPEKSRGRKRELKSTAEKQMSSTRSRSLNSLKNASNKIFIRAKETVSKVMKNK